MRLLTAALVIVVVLAVDALPIAAAEPVRYRPPVNAEVIDPFRPPASRYGAGNRGLLYATTPGQTVVAAADGRVAFAGAVAGRLVVSIDHPDGIRTTYSGLARIVTQRGDRVEQGEAIGTAASRLHAGARIGWAYLDPNQLFDEPPAVRLVPVPSRVAAIGRVGLGHTPAPR